MSVTIDYRDCPGLDQRHLGCNWRRPNATNRRQQASSKRRPSWCIRTTVPRGRMITAEMLEVKQWPVDFVPPTALTKIEDAIDRATNSPMMAGEPVLDAKLASKDSGRGLAALVPPGMRAYTVQTSRVAASVAGFILPGNRVDVLLALHSNPNDGSGGGSTTTLLQAVIILAVDQRLDPPAENKMNPNDKGSVTLLVTPEQAALLDLGQSMGSLTLSLRNLDDTDQEATKPATLADLQLWHDRKTPSTTPTAEATDKKKEAETKVAPEVTMIRTMRGRYSGKVMVAR